jgi:hypothetical protein
MTPRNSAYNNDDDDTVEDGRIPGGYRREPDEEDADYSDVLKKFGIDLKNLKRKHHEKLVEAYKRSMKKRQAQAKWEHPGNGRIKIRREGFFARPNPQDKKRANASKANMDRGILLVQVVREQGDFAQSGKRYLMGIMEEMFALDTEASEELQPIGEALTEIINEELTGTFTEALTMIGQLGFQEVALATEPGQES